MAPVPPPGLGPFCFDTRGGELVLADKEWYRLHKIPELERGKPWHFKYRTVNHVYYPLAQSSGKIFDLLRAHKTRGGNRAKKLFQFLNIIGARGLGRHLGRVLEMAESSADKTEYETKFSSGLALSSNLSCRSHYQLTK
jgi:hypothetical protein